MAVEVDGLDEVRRELRGIDREIKRQYRQEMKRAVEPFRAQLERDLPKRSRRLAKSTKAQAADRGAKVKVGTPSRVPYAGKIIYKVHKRRRYVKRALRRTMPAVRDGIGLAVRNVLDRVHSG